MPFLLAEFEGFVPGPDGVDAHGSPGFAVDVIESDGLSYVSHSVSRFDTMGRLFAAHRSQAPTKTAPSKKQSAHGYNGGVSYQR